ncbi:1994_t:CDS:2, partial [Funneliformis mosseae]
EKRLSDQLLDESKKEYFDTAGQEYLVTAGQEDYREILDKKSVLLVKRSIRDTGY